ncbi:hypothetical protein MMC28_001458 [Mycoblastus sanguinarius]|nr:hypothetical protein [Mycoblastus sanguinarius]
MGSLSRQDVQASLIEPYNTSFEEHGYSQAQKRRTEQSIAYQTNALRSLDSWRNFSVPYRTDIPYENIADGDIDNQNCDLATVDSNNGPSSQSSDSQEIGNLANPSTIYMSGIHPSLTDESFLEKCGAFLADVDGTDLGGSDAENEPLLRNTDDLDDHSPNGPLTSTPSRFDTVSTKTHSRVASNTTPRFHRRARRPVSSRSSKTTCKKCDDDPECEHKPVFVGSTESQKTSLGRHMRDEHSGSQDWSYQCLLDKDGSACMRDIKLARGRRKHVESLHLTQSRLLPPKDDKRNPNAETNAMLEKWFTKIPRTSSR